MNWQRFRFAFYVACAILNGAVAGALFERGHMAHAAFSGLLSVACWIVAAMEGASPTPAADRDVTVPAAEAPPNASGRAERPPTPSPVAGPGESS